MTEIWRDIPGWKGMYQASNLGRIKSLARYIVTVKGTKYPIEEKILKGHVDTKGYIQVEFKRNRRRHIIALHRLIALAFIPNPENKPQINHINGNKTDNRIENLEWCTGSENVRHAWNNRLNHALHGEQHPNAKLTNEQAKWVKEHYIPRDKEYGVNAMARKFNVSTTPIYNILKKKGWKHIE